MNECLRSLARKTEGKLFFRSLVEALDYLRNGLILFEYQADLYPDHKGEKTERLTAEVDWHVVIRGYAINRSIELNLCHETLCLFRNFSLQVERVLL